MTSLTTTAAPSAASRFAMASPIPRPEPVTIATLPANFFSAILLILSLLFTNTRSTIALVKDKIQLSKY
jgi:hypothetical protein